MDVLKAGERVVLLSMPSNDTTPITIGKTYVVVRVSEDLTVAVITTDVPGQNTTVNVLRVAKVRAASRCLDDELYDAPENQADDEPEVTEEERLQAIAQLDAMLGKKNEKD